ncbi:MAG: hypothetical protein NC133_03360 [Prevotella sp.]|nr:hypothetical protein [Prevotella sp.]
MGEDRSDDLQEREDALAEEYAAEDGGTGLDYYNDEAYDYEASSPLTDVDYQSSYDESSQYTDNNTGAEAYDPINRDTDDEQGFDDEDETSDSNYGMGYDTDDDDDDDGDVDDENDDEDEDEDNEDDEIADGEFDVDNADASNAKRRSSKMANDIPQEVTRRRPRISWQNGDRIDLRLLAMVWDDLHRFMQLKPLIDSANQAVESAILSSATVSLVPRYVKFYQNIRQWMGDHDSDFIGSLLAMATKFGVRTTFTAVSTAAALISQTWVDPVVFATLPTVLDGVLATPPVQAILSQIFAVGVPLIEEEFH